MPYGSVAQNDGGLDVDMGVGDEGKSPQKKSKEPKGKKRKVEGDSPKKSKRAKTDM